MRYILDLTVTIDHNVVDGAPATRFAADLRRLMQTAAVLAPATAPMRSAVPQELTHSDGLTITETAHGTTDQRTLCLRTELRPLAPLSITQQRHAG